MVLLLLLLVFKVRYSRGGNKLPVLYLVVHRAGMGYFVALVGAKEGAKGHSDSKVLDSSSKPEGLSNS